MLRHVREQVHAITKVIAALNHRDHVLSITSTTRKSSHCSKTHIYRSWLLLSGALSGRRITIKPEPLKKYATAIQRQRSQRGFTWRYDTPIGDWWLKLRGLANDSDSTPYCTALINLSSAIDEPSAWIFIFQIGINQRCARIFQVDANLRYNWFLLIESPKLQIRRFTTGALYSFSTLLHLPGVCQQRQRISKSSIFLSMIYNKGCWKRSLNYPV